MTITGKVLSRMIERRGEDAYGESGSRAGAGLERDRREWVSLMGALEVIPDQEAVAALVWSWRNTNGGHSWSG
ncbi:hypothetical protein PC116_g19623 [Phytophthora cactorum]|uniref:Uncharacterized protein n=1 Tax=Phytophthora cactorum TaxID=29920 RepID=A0A8T1K9Z6_9STRA|nr:hypothetical protein Pcac1_g6730 [Phytophthora cactorum]KAG2901054.1 hypothetical protein PC114_g13327 [Phytophthora cactorum]KAG2940259.1 hypothetical protein PC117_g10597 [Phytophthora cactorum]KAG3018409.1 hypothetical protein PC119_g10679 [Phytophthora cactorum]KAG3148417.1 hypothetical protein C6341_g17407 [Phytophthora cactorum]